MNPSTHPIHPTTSTSTHERATMDGSTIEATKARLGHEEQTLAAEIEHLGQPITNALHRQLALDPDHNTTETTDQSRPVVGLVARVLGDDELADAIDMGDESWFWPVGGEAADVGDVLRDLQATRAEVGRLQSERSADGKSIGVLAAAVAKVAALHVDDGDGWCKACQTLGYPCPTVLALGAGR